MSYTIFISLLVASWFIFEIYLLWLNYKGRFRYKLKEAYSVQRWLQERIGVIILTVTLMGAFVIIWLAPYGIVLLFNISYVVAFPSVVSGMLGLRFLNVYVDRLSVDEFEKCCLKCEHKEECSKFLNEKCSREYLKHGVRMAIEYERER